MKKLALGVVGLLVSCGSMGGVKVDLSGLQVLDLSSQQVMLNAVNAARATPRNCKNPGGGTTALPAAPAVQLNSKLTLAAQYHAQDMARNQFLAHQGSKGDLTADRIRASGYGFAEAGENLSVVKTSTSLTLQKTVEASIQEWLNSTNGHCQTLMDADFRELGVGFAENASSTDRYYWVQVFGKPAN
ncbi:CAP domain-containing protein [Deinococcus cellulosilyticus]|uniref:SCP domain-containing protein n=1 Tax=Deinococcus cellulosilyticus (strain DSM 18568 / NBRC 106333 / KACC 11606 / 5516J-15) TaxID=1223518 RepID=A0A511N8Q7_DEIC1|nr:CAP domain-containing protein [Deinococcus cellulosilyticus]GEM48868.1 hypothetical protein DC3_45030 [Deinococcus cellulosilyticus NBRC 106333 = KACC 11606]